MRIATGTPVVLDPDGTEVPLRRIAASDQSVQEDLIRNVALDHPSVLPVAEIEPAFLPLIPIGKEIPTSAGPIDAMFITPDGGLTIVEAKLWRNPEARRQVVGQILDYATAVADWSYEKLDGICMDLTSKGLWELVSTADGPGGFSREEEFVDAVARTLRTGRFLLLIVGDGIREEVERIAAYVQAAPQLQFTLALVELRIFEHPDDGTRLVVPSVVARTTEVTRAVVQVDVAPAAKVAVAVTVPADESSTTRRALTLDQFYATLAKSSSPALADFLSDVFDDFDDDPRFSLSPGKASVSLRLKNPTTSGEFTVLVFQTNGFAYAAWLKQQCVKAGVPAQIGLDFVAEVGRMLGIGVSRKNPDELAESVALSAIEANWPQVRDRIERLADDIHTALGA